MTAEGSPDYLALLDKVPARVGAMLEEMRELHKKKNAGYSGDSEDRWANFRDSELVGVEAWRGALIRMTDKYKRITNLAKDLSLDKVGESIEDTLMDLAAYALIVICLRREKNVK